MFDNNEEYLGSDGGRMLSVIREHRSIILILLFYAAGLILGVMLLQSSAGEYAEKIIALLPTDGTDFRELLLHRLMLYLSAWLLCLLLGFSLFGFAFLYGLPLVCGGGIGVKIAAVYAAYHWKGVGYAVLLLLPQATVFITLLLFCSLFCTKISRGIFISVYKKSDMNEANRPRSYLKYLLLMLILFALCAAIDAGLTAALTPLIKLG